MPVVVSKPPMPAPSPGAASRFAPLDITKGILVLLMIVYHSINYSSEFYLAFRYMAFLPPTFIIVTGYLLGRVYAPRAGKGGNPYRRLLERGGKLFLVFILLNIGAQSVRSQNYHGQAQGLRHFFVHWPDTFLAGGSRAAAFEVLLPIAYLLLLGPILLILAKFHRAVIPLVTAATFVVAHLLERSSATSANLNFMAAGLLGMSLSAITWEGLQKASQHLGATILGYLAYSVLANTWGQTFLLQILGATLALAIVLGFSQRIATTRIGRLLALVGTYSLIAYILQIAVLQLLSHFFGRPPPVSLELVGYVTLTLALTTGLVLATDWLRSEVHLADRAYKAIFP